MDTSIIAGSSGAVCFFGRTASGRDRRKYVGWRRVDRPVLGFENFRLSWDWRLAAGADRVSRERQRELVARVAMGDEHLVQSHITNNVEPGLAPGSKIYTDEHTSYDNLPDGFVREFVSHLDAYVQGRVHTNGLENFWSL